MIENGFDQEDFFGKKFEEFKEMRENRRAQDP